MFSSPKHITRLSVLANSMLITGSCAGNRRLQCFAEWMPECADAGNKENMLSAIAGNEGGAVPQIPTSRILYLNDIPPTGICQLKMDFL
jgi:hypothetical protein